MNHLPRHFVTARCRVMTIAASTAADCSVARVTRDRHSLIPWAPMGKTGAACKRCNWLKDCQTPEEAHMPLLRAPTQHLRMAFPCQRTVRRSDGVPVPTIQSRARLGTLTGLRPGIPQEDRSLPTLRRTINTRWLYGLP